MQLNLRKNVYFAVAEFGTSLLLLFISYRLILSQGGLQTLGLWATLYAWTSLIRVGDIGMANAVLRYTALHNITLDRDLVGRHLETAVLANGAFFAVSAVIGYLAFGPWVETAVGSLHADEAKQVLPFLFVGFVLFNLSGVILGGIQGLHLGYIRSLIAISGSLVQLLVAVLLVPRIGITGLALAQILQYTTVTLGAWIVVRNALKIRTPIPVHFQWPVFKELLGFSAASQVANLANGLFEPIVKIVIAQHGGLAVQGLFELAYKTVWLPRQAIVAGTTAAIPALTATHQSSPTSVLPIYKRSVRASTCLSGITSLVVLGATPVVSTLWMGHPNFEYTLYAAILVPGVVLSTWGATAYNLGTVLGVMRGNIISSALALGSFLLLGGFLGTVLPGTGLVVTTSLSMGVMGISVKLLNEHYLTTTVRREAAGREKHFA